MKVSNEIKINNRGGVFLQTRPVVSSYPRLLFGNSQKADTVSSPALKIPDIPLPGFTQADLLQMAKTKPFFIPWGIVRLKLSERRAKQHLPEGAKQELRSYTRFQYWKDKLFRNRKEPGYAERMAVMLEGPPAIKQKQAEVDAIRKHMDTFTMAQSLFNDMGKKNLFLKPIAWILNWLINRQIVKMSRFEPLLDNVPPYDQKFFQKEIDALKKLYLQKTGKTIVAIDGLLGSGSIAQVYLATVKSPTNSDAEEKIVIKVLRPNAEVSQFEGYRNYLYYKNLMQLGNDKKQDAAEKADQIIAMLKREIQLNEEATVAGRLQGELERLGIQKIKIPQIMVSTERGVIQEFAGKTTLNQATDVQRKQVLNRIAPDLIKLAVLSPEKYLDFHSGNIVLKTDSKGEIEQISLIDFLRFGKLDPMRHQNLLTLFTAVFASGLPAIGDELSLDDPALNNPQVKQAIASVLAKDSVKPDTEDDLKQLLSRLVGERGRETICTLWSRAMLSEKPGKKTPWTLNPVTQHVLADEDIKQIHKKFSNLIGLYFSIPGENQTRDMLLQQLKSMSPQDFLKTFEHPIPEDRKSGLRDLDFSIEGFLKLYKLAARGKTQEFTDALAAALKSERTQNQFIRTYLTYTKFRSLAQELTPYLVKASNLTLSEQQRQNVERNLEVSLRNDFGMGLPVF